MRAGSAAVASLDNDLPQAETTTPVVGFGRDDHTRERVISQDGRIQQIRGLPDHRSPRHASALRDGEAAESSNRSP